MFRANTLAAVTICFPKRSSKRARTGFRLGWGKIREGYEQTEMG